MSRRHPPRRHSDRRHPPAYEVEIPSRDDILAFLGGAAGPSDFETIMDGLSIEGDPARTGMGNRLRAMVRDGELVLTKQNLYGITGAMNLVPGTVTAHPDGYAFVKPDEDGPDIFIPAKYARMALHGDRVAVRPGRPDERGRVEGVIVKVLDRANETIVGRFFRDGGIGFVTPDNRRLNQDVLVQPGKEGDAKDGDYVKVRLTQQPGKRHGPIGEVEERIGTPSTPGMATELAIRAYDIPDEWPQAVIDEAARIPDEVEPEAKQNRRDLTELAFVTIDGEDARDFDDAVYAERNDDGWVLWVAIADVSHYVRPGSALDEEAIIRGNSVYFPNRVIPMLPEKLSNGLCSLNPKVDRLAMVAEMHLGPKGKLKHADFYPAVIHSQARLTYNKVQAHLDGEAVEDIQGHIAEGVERLHELYTLLLAKREQRGALEIDTVETYVVLNDDDQIEDIRPRKRFDAHKLIEEFMVLANVATAQYVTEREQPALFRVHARPDEEKVLDLKVLLASMKLSLGGGDNPNPKDFARVLIEARELPQGHLVQTAVLRTMMMAVYSPKNDGHFGLALDAYAHFTSPIRRYPDLVLHRAIKTALGIRGHMAADVSFEDMKLLGEACSATERRADEATRDAMARMKCEYMADRVGESFLGRIISVTAFGLFVELDDVYVEGLVHITSLPRDYYEHEPELQRLVGRRSGQVFQLGEAITVKVARVDVEDKKIDFLLAEADDVKGPVGAHAHTAASVEATVASAPAEPKREKKSDGGRGKRRGGRRKR